MVNLDPFDKLTEGQASEIEVVIASGLDGRQTSIFDAAGQQEILDPGQFLLCPPAAQSLNFFSGSQLLAPRLMIDDVDQIRRQRVLVLEDLRCLACRRDVEDRPLSVRQKNLEVGSQQVACKTLGPQSAALVENHTSLL